MVELQAPVTLPLGKETPVRELQGNLLFFKHSFQCYRLQAYAAATFPTLAYSMCWTCKFYRR
jgi:hypothetical protein